MAAGFLLLNLFILAVTLESDLGRRRIGWFRVLRPVLGAIVAVPFFFTAMAWTGLGLLIEVGGLLAGLALGIAACSLIRYEHDDLSGRTYTRAGVAYALAWIAVAGVKFAASYGAQHWFAPELGRWMAAGHVSPDALRSGFIFLGVSTPIARVAMIYSRGVATARRTGASLTLFGRRATA